jgi:hypothetical protein
MRSDRNARPLRAAHGSPSPERGRGSPEESFSVWRLIGGALALLCLLALVWAAGHVHPEITSVSAAPLPSAAPGSSGESASSAGAALALNDSFAQAVKNDVHISALEDITFIRRSYSIPESALVAPRPDSALFGETDDPNVVQAVVDSAAALLDGQTLAWNRDIAFMPGSTIRYYCDETILAIAWKEALGNSAVSFGEIKTADGSQIRRYIANNSYGSDVQLYASDMARDVNAVIALNGDFYAFRKVGITVYARQLYRNEGKSLDTCFVTSDGDLVFAHRGELQSDEDTRRFMAEHDVVFSLSFGPILVENGELKSAESYGSYPIGEINNIYSRSGIGQLGDKHYLIATLGEQGPYNTRAQLYTFAGYLAAKGCESAYALDGGQTAVMIFNGQTFNRVDWDSERTMSDIIYFATAKDAGEGAAP